MSESSKDILPPSYSSVVNTEETKKDDYFLLSVAIINSIIAACENDKTIRNDAKSMVEDIRKNPLSFVQTKTIYGVNVSGKFIEVPNIENNIKRCHKSEQQKNSQQ